MTGIGSPTDRRVYAGPALPVQLAPREQSGPRAYQLPFLRLVQRSGVDAEYMGREKAGAELVGRFGVVSSP
jgi:hypothetical protein